MQQPGPMFPVMPSFPPNNITTEQIQKYLDENKKLILAILDNQNLGKLAECAQYQAQLQKNLMYLAAIADAQPQTPAMPTQMTPPHPAMQQPGGFYMPHHPQASPMQHPAGGLFPPRGPPFTSPHPMQEQAQAQIGVANMGQLAGGGPSNSGLDDMLLGGGSKQDNNKAAASSDAARGNSPAAAAGNGEEAK
ncbi:GRF1-interacting factor 3 [Striga hermonthica]|uniref:GRF1-interacting factor 3 n=1 Tax=Striga hermonthica TaxID=68872 RepID=A0A9N7NYH9_STRHE|nr:GRF1-interacting factor 3 [Striga hermonthica]